LADVFVAEGGDVVAEGVGGREPEAVVGDAVEMRHLAGFEAEPAAGGDEPDVNF
jgi:hypothetical protein